MTLTSPLTAGDFFFRFGPSPDIDDGLPMVWLNGGLMADTGSEKKEYLFDNQYRYPIYAAMIGMRPLLLIHDDTQIPLYFERLDQIKKDMALLNTVVDPYPCPGFADPLFLPCDKSTNPYTLIETDHFNSQINNADIINKAATKGVCLNQISPAVTDLLKQFYGSLPVEKNRLSVDLDAYEEMAQKAIFWHDKNNYVQLLKPHINSKDIPCHVPCAVIGSDRLEHLTFEKMKTIFYDQTGISGIDAFFIKSNQDAAGEVVTAVCNNNFQAKIAALQKEILEKITLMGRQNRPIKILVQPYIQRHNSGLQPSSIGITYNILGEDNIKRVVVIGHVYEDPEHQTFIGSFESDDHTRQVLSRIDEDKILNLMRLFAQKGYQGPINLDAVLDMSGNYLFIYDCNPRLGGSFPGIAFKNAMVSQGHPVDSLMTLGYRGRFVYPDLAAKLDQLYSLDLLYTRKHPKGLCMIPSFVRPDSYDFVFINAPHTQLQQILDKGVLDTLSDERQKDLKGIYL